MTMSNKKIIALSFTLCCALVICILPRISTAELPIGEELSDGEFSVFENIYISETGNPETISNTFVIPNLHNPWTFRLMTGEKVTSVTITLNGIEVMKHNFANQQVEIVETPVTLLTTNTIDVTMASELGGLLGFMIIGIDNNHPLLSITAPNDGELLASSRPTITGVYSDDISGINIDSFLILLDNVDITSKTFVGTGSFEYTPAAPAIDGAHTLFVSVDDNAGNTVQKIISFTTDSTAPVVNIIGPHNLSVFVENHITATIAVTDANIHNNSTLQSTVLQRRLTA